MNAAIRGVAREPYFEDTEPCREELVRRKRERFLDGAYGAMMTLLAVAALVALKLALSF